MKTVALDAMGGDDAPLVEVEGAVAAARERTVRVVLVGDQARLEAELARYRTAGLPLEVRHASQVITMHDAPSAAVRRKRDASMRVAVDLARSGVADAAVSAGNSGAMMACGLLVLKRLPGVDRPAILTTFPTRDGHAALLDMGANVECKPLNLVQFAMMGAAFAASVHRKTLPRVGVLSNGAEDHKGTELTRTTHRLLREHACSSFHYVGYVEGRDIFKGRADVVVCDGFTGNLVLKVTEGAAETLVHFLKESIQRSLIGRVAAVGMIPAFRLMKRRMDYSEQGGAPLLGVDGVMIICHGGSNAKAIKNAIIGAAQHSDLDVRGVLLDVMRSSVGLMEAARGRRSAQESEPAQEGGGIAVDRQGEAGAERIG